MPSSELIQLALLMDVVGMLARPLQSLLSSGAYEGIRAHLARCESLCNGGILSIRFDQPRFSLMLDDVTTTLSGLMALQSSRCGLTGDCRAASHGLPIFACLSPCRIT